MKVKCKQLNPENKKNYVNWITEGKDYHVLSIFCDKRSIFFYRIIGDDGITPALYESSLFIPISSKIPCNWIIDLDEDVFQLSPASWLTSGFWEQYFDGDQEARKIFSKETRIIMDFE